MAPERRVEPHEAERFIEITDEWLADFADSLDELPGPREQLERSGSVVAESLLEWKWRFGDGQLGRWNGADVERYLLEFFPAQMPFDEQLIADAPACAIGFLRFLERSERSTGAPADELAELCEALRAEFEAATRDRRRWGISKTFATQMEAEGGDPSDPEALQRWIADFNSRPFEERDRIIGPALEAQRAAAAGAVASGPGPAPAPFELDDQELERIVEEVQDEIRYARELLHQALGDRLEGPPPELDLLGVCEPLRRRLSRGGHPYDWIRRASGLDDHAGLPDEELLLRCVAGTISPREDTGLETDAEVAIISLEDADWLGAVVSAVRAGPGSPADPASLVKGIHACPEVEVSPEVDRDDDLAVELAFEILSPAWLALGVIDDDSRLTPLGAWALPRALSLAWDV